MFLRLIPALLCALSLSAGDVERFPAPERRDLSAMGFVDLKGKPCTVAAFRGKVVVVDFWAVWCGPCKMIAPHVAALAKEFAGRALVGKLNVDENPRTAGQYGIMSIPTLLIFSGGKVVDQIVGAQPAAALRQRLERHVR